MMLRLRAIVLLQCGHTIFYLANKRFYAKFNANLDNFSGKYATKVHVLPTLLRCKNGRSSC